MTRVPWLPIKLGPCSNGEFQPRPSSAVVQEAMRRAEAACEANARRLGMSRRRFLASTCGAATTLLVLAACSDEAHRASGSTTSAPGGTFAIPPEATTESTAADAALGGEEPIVDVQTHLLEFDPAHPPAGNSFGSGFPQASCGDAEWWQCFSVDHWMEKVFLESDTTMAVISAVPVVADPDPLSIEVMEQARRVAEELCGDGRVLLQGHAVPNVGRPAAALDAMAALVGDHPVAAWKVYTHYGDGFFLDDDGIGAGFLAKVEELGVPIVSVHKGFSGGDRFAAPVDIGPAAVAHPGIAFVVYHSGFEPGNAEGPYDPEGNGVDRLVRTVSETGIAPGSNVYAELGSTWRTVMGSPDEAAHVLGKVLTAVGEDNVLWGTDSIWYGSPQDQIQAFRAFEITGEFQERVGYPPLTPEVKAKILGSNAARLYDVDPATAPCRFDRAELARIREERAFVPVTEGPVAAGEVAATFRRDHPWF